MMTLMDSMSTLSLAVGGALAPTAVFVEMVHLKITDESDKAVQVADKLGRKLWLPKKALVRGTFQGKPSDWFKLAKWFKPNDYALKFLERASEVSGQSAV
jgi:hypothetical protein